MPRALPVIDVSAPVCCAPLGEPSVDPAADALEIATRLKALADPGRIRIVQALACCEGHEMTTTEAGELLAVSEATANHHLKRLQKAGILAPHRDGQKVFYRLDLVALRQLGTVLQVRCSAACDCA
ncbi:metalloregulator ArsR/SmtB family transcription factor [Demequina sp. TTPB684]|uniref:ArsR/SmtB family transcription factor n=1 Tax=unclassified Demequina TaxID=2620311 RepID=UPI001CF4F739|nr:MULTISPECIES: metalloregulator ArsR/SmtB family transcription factor [unclassified Demequina]MCB2413684.1 metalloregulator ArsR/SmtB family transcription factor [Demequina sp. TTPB684]UPU87746.1 metalloregulator ArsR/SmtB family transcription factor [Demequina sp. TMPB413]